MSVMEANLQADPAPSLQLPGEIVQEPVPSIRLKFQQSVGTLIRRFRKIACAIVALAVLLLALGHGYNVVKARADVLRFPQQGKSVDIGGYKLNINCTGQGSPTVVLEAGLGVPAVSWRAVQAGIAKFTRVCSYDRAGYEWSDPGPMPRTTSQSVKELHTLLQNAGERPPYVLVGHSFGGTNVRIYASRYPAQIAGVVLADTGNENMKFPNSIAQVLEDVLNRRRSDGKWGRLLYWSGISRFEARKDIEDPASTFDQQEYAYFLTQPNLKAAAASEYENLDEGKNELRSAGNLGDKPLTVLIAEDNLSYLPISLEERASLSLSWIDSEKSLASLSSRGKWVMVPGSGHMLPFDRPEAIINAAHELWAGTQSH